MRAVQEEQNGAVYEGVYEEFMVININSEKMKCSGLTKLMENISDYIRFFSICLKINRKCYDWLVSVCRWQSREQITTNK